MSRPVLRDKSHYAHTWNRPKILYDCLVKNRYNILHNGYKDAFHMAIDLQNLIDEFKGRQIWNQKCRDMLRDVEERYKGLVDNYNFPLC